MLPDDFIVLQYHCSIAPETRPLPAVSCAHPARDVDRLSSDGRRWKAVIPRPPVVRGPMAVALPRSRSPRTLPWPFWTRHCPLLIVRRRRWGPVIGRERRRVRPVIAPPPLRAPGGWLSNSDHAGKSTYSGEIESLVSRPGNCDCRPGNAISRELTSLFKTSKCPKTSAP